MSYVCYLLSCSLLVTPSKIQAMFVNSDKTSSLKESPDNHLTEVEEDDIDEGEILSDEEEDMEGEKEAKEQPKIKSVYQIIVPECYIPLK